MTLFGDRVFIRVIELNEIVGLAQSSTTGIRTKRGNRDTETDTHGKKMT